MANQLMLLFVLPVVCLLGRSSSSGNPSSIVKRDVAFGANCLRTQQQYDLCNDDRGYCDYPGNGNGQGRLKCYEGLACDAFPGVAHGSFVLTDPQDNVLGATAELTCCTGYHIEGATTTTCGVNSTWSTASGTCEANDCGPIPSVDEGAYATPFGATTYPTVGYLKCDPGFLVTYTSLGDTFLRCYENGTWVPGSATCEPVDCGDPPTTSNGQFNASAGTDYLSEAHLECIEKFFPVNETLITIVCDASGHWTDPQTTCFTPECDSLQEVDHGYFVLTDPNDNVLGATAELTCCSGYHTDGATTITCGVDSTWSTTSGTCEANDCESTPSVDDGAYATPFGTTYPEVGYLTCGTGFVVTYASLEDTFIKCDANGAWIPGSATCEPVECGDPPTISNGQFNASDGTDYLSEAHLECNEYFLPGNGSLLTIVCEASGQWSTPQTACFTPAGDCTDLQAQGATTSGVYTVTIDGTEVDVLCEMEGGSMWTVIQQRVDGTVSFYRDWEAYQQGFGDLNGNFWLGLDNIYNIVGTGTQYRVKFHITDSIKGDKTATYQTFSITDESDKYRLNIAGYSGDAGDDMSIHNTRQFTTKDSDNDEYGSENCAIKYIGAWWYKACHSVNLNGDWDNIVYGDGLNWKTTTTYYRSATYTRIQVQQTGP